MESRVDQIQSLSHEEILIAVLRSELQEIELPSFVAEAIRPECIPVLYKLAKAHDLAHILAISLDKMGLLGADEISIKLQKQAMLAVYRCEQFKQAFSEIEVALKKANIDYIPLKGSVIRPYYPEESMRTSSDIDILIRMEDIPRAETAVTEQLSYARKGESVGEVSYLSPSGVHLEFHYYSPHVNADDMTFFADVWSNCTLVEGSRHDLSPKMFLGYHIVHMAKHFQHGGCGIRPFMDLWIMEHKMAMNPQIADEILQDQGLLQFANASFALSNAWFGDGEHTSLTKNMADYLMNGGVYGTLENQSAIVHVKSGGRVRVFFSRAFLPYSKMVQVYPSLHFRPILYPFYVVHRWFRILRTKGGGGSIRRMKRELQISDDKRNHVASLLNDLNL